MGTHTLDERRGRSPADIAQARDPPPLSHTLCNRPLSILCEHIRDTTHRSSFASHTLQPCLVPAHSIMQRSNDHTPANHTHCSKGSPDTTLGRLPDNWLLPRSISLLRAHTRGTQRHSSHKHMVAPSQWHSRNATHRSSRTGPHVRPPNRKH